MPDSEFKTKHFACLMAASFLSYLSMVMPLSSLSIHITRDWGLSNFLAGTAAGAAFFTCLLCRKYAGDLVDRIGGKRCFLRGALCYTAGGLFCLFSSWEALPAAVGYPILIIGRLILGFGESQNSIGIAHWCIGRLGTSRSGRIFATHGMCMYSSVALGGWAGYTLSEKTGFTVVMAVCVLAPLLALGIAWFSPAAAPAVPRVAQLSTWLVVKRIWRLCLPSGLHGVAFAILGAFLSKTFMERGWSHASFAFTVSGMGFVGMRLIIGTLPDRWGGLAVARLSGLIEMLGGYLLWLAPEPLSALAGSFLVGAGCSMVFPSISLEVVRLAPEMIRGACLSLNSAFVDMAYCFSAPIAGLAIDWIGGGDDHLAYLLAALAVTLGQALLLRLALARRRGVRESAFSARWTTGGTVENKR
jgi:MFS family permease